VEERRAEHRQAADDEQRQAPRLQPAASPSKSCADEPAASAADEQRPTASGSSGFAFDELTTVATATERPEENGERGLQSVGSPEGRADDLRVRGDEAGVRGVHARAPPPPPPP
jgi:hypothetical protein